MLRNLQKLVKQSFLRNSTIPQSQAIQKSILSKEQHDYLEALKNSKNRLKEIMFGESQQLSLLKNCVQQKLDSQKVLQYGEQAIWEYYSNQDYLNVIKCGKVVLPYIEEDISQSHISIGFLSLVIAESLINQNQLTEATEYLKRAEDSYFLNASQVEAIPLLSYQYTLMLAEMYSKIRESNKSIIYATICLQTEGLAFEQKITPCYLLSQFYLQQKNKQQALAFGKLLLKEVTFNNLINSYSPKEIKSLQDIYRMMIDLTLNTEKDMQKAYVLIDEMLLLLKIIKSQDTQMISDLKQKQDEINKKLKNQEDLLFVLGFYGQKLKLEQQSFSERHNTTNQ